LSRETLRRLRRSFAFAVDGVVGGAHLFDGDAVYQRA
jgi:hypothetical protein